MIVIILSLIIPIAIGIYFGVIWSDWLEGLSAGLFSLLISLIVCVIIVFGGGALVDSCTDAEVEITHTNTAELVAFKDSSEMSGVFFLGTGYVGEDLNYHYVMKTDKGMEVKHISMEDCYLNYDDEPRIEHRSYRFKNPVLYCLFVGPECEDYIFVPKDSITNEYCIDLE